MKEEKQIESVFRTEYSKLIAVLCKTYGLSQIEIAEDIVSATFIQASETWKLKGIPKSPTGWLYTVAKNRTKDYLKRKTIFEQKINPVLQQKSNNYRQESLDLSSENIEDGKLRMLFAIVHPSISKESQIAIALKILCGFSIDQITTALVSNKSAVNKLLFRAKQKLRKGRVKLDFPEGKALETALDNVLSTLYLLFNEGYHSKTEDKQLNKEFCTEALYLSTLLLKEPTIAKPKVYALIALMCFHSSRFKSRFHNNTVFLYEEQNRTLWDNELIEKGEEYLNLSATGDAISNYHLEAAIAYWHTQDDDKEKWENILQLYNYLLQLTYSPIAAMNRTYALSKARSVKEAIVEAKKINLNNSYLYHCLLAKFYETISISKAILCLEKALKLKIPKTDKEIISFRLIKLKSKCE